MGTRRELRPFDTIVARKMKAVRGDRKQFEVVAALNAAGLEMSQGNFSNYENGMYKIPAELLYVLAGIYGCTVSDFIP